MTRARGARYALRMRLALVAVVAFAAAACRPAPPPAAPAEVALWQPIDPMFEGCTGS